jgi:ATP:corrinoid adenosyltransferase
MVLAARDQIALAAAAWEEAAAEEASGKISIFIVDSIGRYHPSQIA